jgi:hypothetical protein
MTPSTAVSPTSPELPLVVAGSSVTRSGAPAQGRHRKFPLPPAALLLLLLLLLVVVMVSLSYSAVSSPRPFSPTNTVSFAVRLQVPLRSMIGLTNGGRSRGQSLYRAVN